MKTKFFFLILCFSVVLRSQNFQTLRETASRECESGNFKKAIELAEQAIQKAAKDKKADLQEILSLKSEHAAYHLLDEQVEKGVQLFEELLKSVDASMPVAEMNINHNYGVALVFLGAYSEAMPRLERARELSGRGKMETKELVSCLGSLAVCYQYQYQFTKSEQLFNEALNFCKKGKLNHSVDHATLLSNMALLYHDMQQPHKAITCYEAAEKIFISSADTLNPQYPVFLTEYGSLLAESAQFDRALSLSFRAKHNDERMYGRVSQPYAADMNNLGNIYDRMNKIVEAEQCYTEAIEIKKSLSFQRPEAYLTSLSNLIVFYNKVGRTDDAKELAPLLEKGMENKSFTDTLKRATFANNLAVHHKDWGNYDKSYYWFTQAIAYYKSVYGTNNAQIAEVYMDMGILFFSQNKWEEVTNYLNKAAGIYSKVNVEENIQSIITFCNLGTILKEVDQPKEGLKYVERGLELCKKLNVTQPDILEQVYLAKAQLCADLNRIAESMEYFQKYLDLKYSQLERNFSYMTETEKLFFLDQFELNLRNYYAVILSNIEKYPELVETLINFRLRTKSLLLNNLSKIKEQIRTLNDKDLELKFEELKLKRESVAKLMNFNTDEYPEALQEAERLKKQADQLEKEISLKASVTFTSNETKIRDWRDVQKELGPGEAAVEVFQSYLVYNNNQGKGTNYTFIILKPTGAPIAVSIDRPFNWETQLMLHYRNSVEQKKNDPSLLPRVWQFMSEKMADSPTIYFSPDGIYNQINLNTLFNGATGKFLIEEKNIHVLGSLNDISCVKKKMSLPKNCVLAGNPKFDLDLSKTREEPDASKAIASRGAYGYVLSELPGTKTEIENIENILKKAGVNTFVLAEEQASEKNLKAIKSPDILHIATHGFFMEDVNDEVLTGYARMERDYYKNPMLRCGIFLSGSNNTYSITSKNSASLKEFEDGMLTAYEAMNLDLSKTQVVVLSACETGLGKIKNGEGVFGLQRAFRLAGARAMIMSLWPVSDEATKDLMISFYSKWMSSKDLYTAFREAQIELKSKYPEPYYWGAFVLNGL